MEVLVIDPRSIELHRLAAWIMLSATVLVSAVAVLLRGRRAWLAVAGCAVLVPTLSTYLFGARPEWTLAYLPDVVFPLMIGFGIPGSAVGIIAGFALRWLRTKLARPVRAI